MVVMGICILPNSGRAAFEQFLDGVDNCVRRFLPHRVLLLGDFSAHSTEWGGGRRTNACGLALS